MSNQKKKPAKSATSDRFARKEPTRQRALFAAGTVGAIAAGAVAALKLGWLDRFFVTAGDDGDDGAAHAAPDLTADAATPGTHRAPEAFRPDPTAPVSDDERESLRPATGPAPTIAAPPGEMANQTGAAN